MNKTIFERGMTFVADNVFHIEKSSQYAELDDRLKTVEFVRAKNDKLMFVEAKSSFPNSSNMSPNPKKENKTGDELFREEISEICDKFIHSLNLYSAVSVGITADRFPPDYEPANKVSLMFVLVINGFEKSLCGEIERALKQRFRESVCISQIWKPDVCVMNHATAKERHLIAG
ncbi:MAG: hypothetical protein LBK57_01620 [Clostridiales Family XIII bacterium]|jgi:hypothetical protein|nr:hypothetical protein [Clostridiales Family XIII bacterium]